MKSTPQKNEHFDVLIIGAGPGGMAAATRGALKGLKIGLVNGEHIWGYGIHGAYKSKGMYELAKDHMVATKSDRGYHPAEPRVDMDQINKHLIEGTHELEALYHEQLAYLNVCEIKGFASFVDDHTIEVGDHRCTADYIIVATGTNPQWVSGVNRESVRIMTSDEIVTIKELPESLLILGSGVIGCEFASIFKAFGSEVTMLDRSKRILSHEDDDIVDFLTTNYEANGIDIIQEAELESMVDTGDKVITKLKDGTTIESTTALISIGRTPRTAELNLKLAAVETNERGYISVNEHRQSNVRHIYAVGDVAHRDGELDLALVHVAEAEGHEAIHHIMFGREPLPMDHIPFIIFTIPLVAGAGENEKSAREKYGDVRVARLDNVRNHRAHAMRSFAGFVKLIVGPEGDDRLLGVRACGPQADTLIGEVSLCIQNNLPYTYLMDAVHAHPSLSESLHNAARMLAGLYPVDS